MNKGDIKSPLNASPKRGVLNLHQKQHHHGLNNKSKKSSPTRQLSPVLKPIDQYLIDLNDCCYTDFKSESNSIVSDLDRFPQSFNSKVKRHYQYLVKLLPILIIFLPPLLKIFFPKIIKLGHFEIGDNKNDPSNILIDFFSILLICWIIKFLLDWPWKWYSQINEIKQKLHALLESTQDEDKDFQKITNQNLTVLKLQRLCALIMCVGSPFLSGVLLLFARSYIAVIGNDEEHEKSLIFSDLNIGIFVSCGIIRVVIQISEHIQQSTASIEINTEKFISQLNHKSSLDIELRSNTKNSQPTAVLDRLATVEQQLNQLSKKFDAFYGTNKLSIEKNLTFLSSKHFKILEKEINELQFNLHTKTNDLETKIHSIVPPESSSSTPELIQRSQHSSLHGIPLSPKKPSHIGSSSNSFFPVEQYSKLAKQLPSPLSRLGQFFPLLNDYSNQEDSNTEPSEIAMKQLSNLDAIHKYDLTSRPIVEYLLNFPFVFKHIVWKIVSYVPISVLKAIYLILLGILDVLLAKANGNDEVDEIKLKFREGESSLNDESFEEIIAR